MAKARRDFAIPGNRGRIKSSFLWLFQNLLPRHFNDMVLRKHQKIHQGARPATGKVAIYLIFPKFGILPTHLHSLQYMVENGYAPLVISNQPLQPHDIETLRPYVWNIIERLNFGYDFGGYRDGILWLENRLKELKRLVLLNDSAWFPLAGRMNWLSEAEAMGKDLVGAMESSFTPHRKRYDTYLTCSWTVDRNRAEFHYGSFAQSIGPNLLAAKEFSRFWRRLRITQGKNRTIKRGEIGFSQWVISKGFSHGSTTNGADFDVLFAAMSDVELRQVFDRLIYVEDPKIEVVLENITQNPGINQLTRREIEQFLYLAIGNRGASLAVPRLLIELKNYAFLKKYAVKPGTRNTAAFVDLINSLNDPMQQHMLVERGLTSVVSQTANTAA